MLTCEGAVAITWSGYQRSIFRDVAAGEGHTVVLARAGSGKTTTILEALRHVPSGAGVLMAAFNKSIERELAKKAPPRVEVRTLHGYGLSLVRGACGKADIHETKVPMLIEQKLGTGLSLQQRHTLQRGVELAKATLAETAGEVRRLIDDFDLGVPDGKEGEFAEHVRELLDACAANIQIVDFDDMIWACAPGGRICAVGDDRQAIYAWRGADPEAVPRMIDRINAKVLPLSVTYRCARQIVKVANEIVPDLEAAPGAAEGLVANATEERLKHEARPGDFILSRTNAPLVGLCLSFLAEGRPATVAGRDVGAGLTNLIRKSRARSVPELCGWVDDWAKQEAKRLEQKGKDRSGPKDKADCVRKLAEGARSVDEVLNTLQTLFSDKDDGSRIVLSTTHRAKGLERDRAWVLRDTYRRNSTEEENLWYVAVTRAKRELLLVQSAA